MSETNQTKISNGKICPYCLRSTQYIDSIKVYQKSYGMIYYCDYCWAWVGVHKGTDTSLGSLANAELRKARQKAHLHLDALWKYNKNKHKKRIDTYKLIANKMNIKLDKCHIGLFDLQQCQEVVNIILELRK